MPAIFSALCTAVNAAHVSTFVAAINATYNSTLFTTDKATLVAAFKPTK